MFSIPLEFSPNFWRKMRDIVRIGIGGGLIFGGLSYEKHNPTFHKYVTVPIMHQFDPETSHKLAISALKLGIIRPVTKNYETDKLHTELLGFSLKSPIGLAAGFDKDGEAVDGLFKLGFGLVEIGSVTPEPQEGNAKPRVFRLSEDEAVINRYGFNSAGHEAVSKNLEYLPPPGERPALLGINLGKNKSSVDAVSDYRAGIKSLGQYADYIVINVSSPNTPGLRGLQHGGMLGELLDGVLQERKNLVKECNSPSNKMKVTPLLVKIAPDLTEVELKGICDVLMEKKVDGVIISNTTISRPASLTSEHKKQSGGLSGKPLEKMSTEAIETVYKHTKGLLPIIGVGGVSDGAGVYEKLRAGASAVQLYSAMVYRGPAIVRDIEQELLQIMEEKKISSISDIKKIAS